MITWKHMGKDANELNWEIKDLSRLKIELFVFFPKFLVAKYSVNYNVSNHLFSTEDLQAVLWNNVGRTP